MMPKAAREKLMEECGREPMSPKEEALAEYRERKVNPPKQINNASLYAGSPMYFYCGMCGHESDVLPESYTCAPKHLCSKCQTMKNMGWFD
jgi:hypothetical protein